MRRALAIFVLASRSPRRPSRAQDVPATEEDRAW